MGRVVGYLYFRRGKFMNPLDSESRYTGRNPDAQTCRHTRCILGHNCIANNQTLAFDLMLKASAIDIMVNLVQHTILIRKSDTDVTRNQIASGCCSRLAHRREQERQIFDVLASCSSPSLNPFPFFFSLPERPHESIRELLNVDLQRHVFVYVLANGGAHIR